MLEDDTLQVQCPNVQCPACGGQLGWAGQVTVASLQCVVTVNTALGPQVEIQYTVYSEGMVGTDGYRWVQVATGGCRWVLVGAGGYRWVQVGAGGCRRVQEGAGRDGRLHHRAHLSVPGWRVTGDTALFKDTGHGCSVTSPWVRERGSSQPSITRCRSSRSQ